MPMTRATRAYLFHVAAMAAETGLAGAGAIMVDQLRFVAKERFLNQRPAGRLDPELLARVEMLVKAALDLS